ISRSAATPGAERGAARRGGGVARWPAAVAARWAEFDALGGHVAISRPEAGGGSGCASQLAACGGREYRRLDRAGRAAAQLSASRHPLPHLDRGVPSPGAARPCPGLGRRRGALVRSRCPARARHAAISPQDCPRHQRAAARGRKLVKQPRQLWRVAQIVVGSLLFVTLLIVGLGALLPRNWQVEESILINAPVASVHTWVGDLRRWPRWAQWNQAALWPENEVSEPSTGTG